MPRIIRSPVFNYGTHAGKQRREWQIAQAKIHHSIDPTHGFQLSLLPSNLEAKKRTTEQNSLPALLQASMSRPLIRSNTWPVLRLGFFSQTVEDHSNAAKDASLSATLPRKQGACCKCRPDPPA